MNDHNPMLNIDALRAHVRQLTEQSAHIAQLAKQIDDLLESSGKPRAMTQQIIDAEGMRDHFQQRLESVQIKLAQEREKSEGLERDRDVWKAAHDGEVDKLQTELNMVRNLLRVPGPRLSRDTVSVDQFHAKNSKPTRFGVIRPPHCKETGREGLPLGFDWLGLDWFDNEADARAAIISAIEKGAPSADISLVAEVGRFSIKLEWEAKT